MSPQPTGNIGPIGCADMSRWIASYDPEDVNFWETKGKRIARRNLIWSIVVENIGFSVWLMWSITATKLPGAGFPYTTDQLLALGLNAAGGNIGVSSVQLLVPIAIGIGGGVHLQNAGLMWLPLIALGTCGSFLFMDNLATARSAFRDQMTAFGKKHTWIMSFL